MVVAVVMEKWSLFMMEEDEGSLLTPCWILLSFSSNSRMRSSRFCEMSSVLSSFNEVSFVSCFVPSFLFTTIPSFGLSLSLSRVVVVVVVVVEAWSLFRVSSCGSDMVLSSSS